MGRIFGLGLKTQSQLRKAGPANNNNTAMVLKLGNDFKCMISGISPEPILVYMGMGIFGVHIRLPK